MNFLLFEDSFYKDLSPVSVLRPVYDIVTGVFTAKERIERFIPSKSKLSFHCRNLLLPLTGLENPKRKVNNIEEDDYIFINGSALINSDFLNWVSKKMKWNNVLVNEGKVIAAKVSKNNLKSLKEKIENITEDNTLDLKDFESFKTFEDKELMEKNSIFIFNYAWDIVKHTEKVINSDLTLLSKSKKKTSARSKAVKINSKNIFIAKTADIFPNVVLDAEVGKIYIDENAKVEPFSYIKGPVYIGKNVVVKSGAKFYGPCSFGAGSKVTGEIAGSIFHSNVNKQHDGFIGNTYACPFVNFGADTVTSNLKNNYSKIRVKADNGEINTAMQFLGSIVGDHTKFGINTMLNTGSIIGIYANVAGGGFPDKKIDSFAWYIIGSQPVKYKIDEAISTAKIVMGRRHVEMSKEYEELVREVYKSS